MEWIALDFETFFSDDYGLGASKLTTENYVRDARFDPIMVAVKCQGWKNTEWIPKPEIKTVLSKLQLDRCAVIHHHAHFDGLILEHHYDLHPARYICTLSMGRGVLGNGLKLGLEALAHHFGLEPKSVPYDLFKGKHYEELDAATLNLLGEGACHDVELSLQILNYLMAGYTSRTTRPMPCFPAEELALIDQTVRMFTRPRIVGDTNMLADLWVREQTATDELLVELELMPPELDVEEGREHARKQLRSDDKFAALLEAEGVECEEKVTAAGNTKYAFAKTDDFMQQLLDADLDPDVDEWTPGQDRVYLLAQARLRAKSSLEQTRAERLGWMSTRGNMCVYIAYAAAITLRDGGADKVNWQNQKRKSLLRRAQTAPKGYLIGSVDASQVEARFLDTIADEPDAIEAWRSKRDTYSEIATNFYGEPVYNPKDGDPRYDDMKGMRGLGKLIKLSSGYGCSERSIVSTAKKGSYGPPLRLTLDEGLRAKNLYRNSHGAVVASWADGGVLLKMMARFENYDFYTPFEIQCNKSEGTRRIVLPNGMHLIYDSLEWHVNEAGEKYWRVKTRKGWSKLYGSKIIQHCIQAISRVHTMQVALQVERESGLWPWLRNHDELDYLIPDNQHAKATMEWICQVMRTPPAWLPQIPLDAEYTLGERYEK